MVNEAVAVFAEFKDWESTGEMTPERAGVVDLQLETFMEHELSAVEASVDAEPYAAFTGLLSLTLFLNAAATKRPSIIRKLEKWIQRIQAAANALAKKLGADGFSIGISVGWPPGLSLSLSFPVT